MRIGIDLGGTKIEVIALSHTGCELYRHRIPTPRNDYKATIKAICDLVAHTEQKTGHTGSVGVGMPGTISPFSGLVKNANSVWLNARPFDKDLSAALNRPVRFANDANCLAVSEAIDGAGKGSNIVFAVIIGTGCGAGIAIGTKAHHGGNGIGGEWGHNPLPWPSEEERDKNPCYCGKNSCIETWVSGTGFARNFLNETGKNLSSPEIVSLADNGDELALAALKRYEDRLARSIAHVVNILDPDIIVLAGGMSNIKRLYTNLPELMKPWVFGGECETPIVPSLHGDSSGIRGAAWLWDTDV